MFIDKLIKFTKYRQHKFPFLLLHLSIGHRNISKPLYIIIYIYIHVCVFAFHRNISKPLYIIIYRCLPFCYSEAQSQLIVTPQNIATVEGPSLQLNCTTSSPNVAIQWAKYDDLNEQTILSFNTEIVNIPYQGNFSIVSGTEDENTYHNLRMRELQFQYGAMYACIDAAFNQHSFAHLIVLGT